MIVKYFTKTKGLKKYDGYFTYYWDENTGKVWLEVDKLDTEFLYVVSLPAGLGSNDIGLDRGLLGEDRVVKFNKVGRKILLVQPNYSYRALSNDAAEKRAVEQAFAQTTVWGFTTEAESNGKFLVDATDFLMRDAMKVSNTIRRMRQGNYVLDKTRSAMYLARTKNFPLNSELEVSVTYTNSDGEVGKPLNNVADYTLDAALGLRYKLTDWASLNMKAEKDMVSGAEGDLDETRYTLGFGVGW